MKQRSAVVRRHRHACVDWWGQGEVGVAKWGQHDTPFSYSLELTQYRALSVPKAPLEIYRFES